MAMAMIFPLIFFGFLMYLLAKIVGACNTLERMSRTQERIAADTADLQNTLLNLERKLTTLTKSE